MGLGKALRYSPNPTDLLQCSSCLLGVVTAEKFMPWSLQVESREGNRAMFFWLIWQTDPKLPFPWGMDHTNSAEDVKWFSVCHTGCLKTSSKQHNEKKQEGWRLTAERTTVSLQMLVQQNRSRNWPQRHEDDMLKRTEDFSKRQSFSRISRKDRSDCWCKNLKLWLWYEGSLQCFLVSAVKFWLFLGTPRSFGKVKALHHALHCERTRVLCHTKWPQRSISEIGSPKCTVDSCLLLYGNALFALFLPVFHWLELCFDCCSIGHNASKIGVEE